MVKISECIAPSYYDVYKSIMKGDYTHYWLGGGRGSLKSSAWSIIAVMKFMKTPDLHMVLFRKYSNTLKDSVYEQMKWAIEKLGVTQYFDFKVSPMEIIYKPTGQKILFRGLDDAEKTKGIKVATGYFGLVIFEELQEFRGIEEIRKAYQSLMRGTDEPIQVICAYNPPKEITNWVNKDELIKRDDRLVHKSTYLDAPAAWLGENFIKEAEELKKVNELAYNNEYMGLATGSGGKIFNNIKEQEFTDKDLMQFTNVKYGLDWGYTTDPLSFVKVHYDKTRKTLYVFDEIYKTHLLNSQSMPLIKAKIDTAHYNIVADSAEPKSISEFRQGGLRISGAIKGKDSIKYGIEFLQELHQIIIDPKRCPNTFLEFSTYEQERDKNGEFKVGYPDKNNHAIDAIRYAMESESKEKYNKQSSSYDWVGIGL